MLDQLLETLAEGGTYSHSDLARTVGVGEELLHQIIEHLVRMGYLKPIAETCGSGCDDCPVRGICAAGGRGQAWALTEKGSQVVQKLQRPSV
jgi:hypothetical protein